MAGEGIGITARVAKVTMPNWIRQISDQAIKKHELLRRLQAKGRITKADGGHQVRWPFQFSWHQMNDYVDLESVTFPRQRVVDDAYLPVRGYTAQDVYSDLEEEENSGAAAVAKLFDSRQPMMRRSLLNRLASEFFADGTVSGSGGFHGVESFGSTGTQVNTDEVASVLDSTYAGHSASYTSLKATAVDGDPEYGVWSPVVVNCNVHDSGGANQSWADFCDQYVRAAINKASYSNVSDESPDFFLLRKASFLSLLNRLDDKEQITVVPGAETKEWKVGTQQTVYIDGVPITWDAGVPSADGHTNSRVVHGYGFTTSQMELRLLNYAKDSLWKLRIQYDIGRGATLIRFFMFGNLVFYSPKHVAMLKELSA